MGDKITKSPQIRFAEFTDAWEQRKLKELFVKGGSGGTPRSTNKDYYKGKIPFLGISDISNSNGYIYYTQKHISEEGLNNSSAWIVPKGAITLAMYASVGKVAILNVDVATSQAFYNMVFNDKTIRDFIYQRLVKANINEEWRELISTGTQSNLNAEKVKNFQMQLPKDKGEQSKIGKIFNQLDNIITLNQRKYDKLVIMKKSMLEKMFPKDGSNVPEIRYEGFTVAWEQRKLGDLADFFDEKRIPIDSEKRKMGEYPYYGATGIIDYVDGYIFDGEYVLLAEDGANIIMRNSPIAYLTEGKFWLNNHAHIMRMKDGSNKFLLQLLEKQNYEKYNSGTAQPKLNGQVVKKMILSFPSKNEQTKIGSFFGELDKTITLHQRELNLLKNLKKSLLQQMFI
ncbi:MULTISPECIES: restriction endonuclease subunit S [Bacillus]|uniref:restriction endonuclease subunit S n=1 Tax=Bacillus TaxID=1386 RepID=UPI0030F5D431